MCWLWYQIMEINQKVSNSYRYPGSAQYWVICTISRKRPHFLPHCHPMTLSSDENEILATMTQVLFSCHWRITLFKFLRRPPFQHNMQWCSQGLSGWASCPPGRPNEEENEEKLRKNERKYRKLRKIEEMFLSCPPGSERLATALTICHCGGWCEHTYIDPFQIPNRNLPKYSVYHSRGRIIVKLGMYNTVQYKNL